MKANNRARARDDRDGGQLLLLAGIMLVLGFAATAITLSQVADLEKQTFAAQRSRILDEFRFIRTSVGTMLLDATSTTADNVTLNDTFSRVTSGVGAISVEKGYDIVVKLAGIDQGYDLSEWNFTHDGWPYNITGDVPLPEPANAHETVRYNFRSHDSNVNLIPRESGAERRWDGIDDGIVWVKPCDLTQAISGSGDGCIKAVIVYLYLADEISSITEYMVYGVNV